MSWDADAPRSNDDLADFPAMLRNYKSSISEGLGQHFYWHAESSGASAGVPRLSTISGSARAFYGTNSQLSARWAGGLMLSSDSGRFGMLDSVSSAWVGGVNCVVGYSSSTFTATETFAVQVGSVYTSAQSATLQNQLFGSAFSTAPLITASIGWSDSTDGWTVSVLSANASGFTYALVQHSAGAISQSSATVYWAARGRRAC